MNLLACRNGWMREEADLQKQSWTFNFAKRKILYFRVAVARNFHLL